MTNAIEVRGLFKSYGRVEALRGLNFDVPRGSIYGLIGPNGAGKTTTLAILAGLMAPTAGQAFVLGSAVCAGDETLKSKIGFASPQFTYFDYLSGDEMLNVCGLMHGLGRDESARRTADLLAMLDLDGADRHYLYEYSLGMRQKIGLACALIHSPEVLLLDEPFESLDPTAVFRLMHTLEQMKTRGKTILLTSHDLGLVERVCDRVAILHEGVVKQEIDRSELAGDSRVAHSSIPLEARLWDVVGKPEARELSWI